LCDNFARLFSLSLQKEACVRKVGVVEGERWSWNFIWRMRLFQWEEDRITRLLVNLENVRLSHEVDCWRWNIESEGCFSVKSTYGSLANELLESVCLTFFEAKIFKNIWESATPSKVIVFS
jgi:hypothetical protein